MLAGGSLANDAVLREDGGEWTIQGDPTEAAFLVAEAKVEWSTEARAARFERVGEMPFTSERKLMTTLDADVERDGPHRRRHQGRAGRAARPLHARARRRRDRVRSTDARRRDVLATSTGSPIMALRTLAVAYRPLPRPSVRRRTSRSSASSCTSGWSASSTHPARRRGRPIAEAHRAGVRVIMITGDHPRTAARIAGDLGIVAPGIRGHDRRRHRAPRRRGAAGRGPARSPSSPGWRPSTSCASSTRCKPTATSSP